MVGEAGFSGDTSYPDFKTLLPTEGEKVAHQATLATALRAFGSCNCLTSEQGLTRLGALAGPSLRVRSRRHRGDTTGHGAPGARAGAGPHGGHRDSLWPARSRPRQTRHRRGRASRPSKKRAVVAERGYLEFVVRAVIL